MLVLATWVFPASCAQECPCVGAEAFSSEIEALMVWISCRILAIVGFSSLALWIS